MIDVHWVILGAVISALGASVYVRDTVRGTSQPNRVTFLLWGAAPLLAFGVEITNGVGLRSLMTFMSGAAPLVVFAASFRNRHGVWRLTTFDWVCGALSVGGTAMWLATRQGLIGIAAAIAADALAGLPTLLKSWRAPHTETAFAYLCGAVNAGITLLTITHWTAFVAAFPLYIFTFASVQVALVGGRLGPRLRARRLAACASS